MAEVQAASATRSEERYVGGQYPAVVTSSMSSSSSSQSSFEATVWQQYRHYQSQFYRSQQPYLPQYAAGGQYQPVVAASDVPAMTEPALYQSPSSAWFHPASQQYHPGHHQQPQQLHLPDGLTPAYHRFREMNGLCCYDSVY